MSEALVEITRAESLLSNWKYLPGSQIKILVSHLINALDAVASYAFNEPTTIERAYLTLSSVRLFDDTKIEVEFYDTYFFLKNLLRRNIERVNPDTVRVIGVKQVFLADRDYFDELIGTVREVVNEAFKT